MGTGPIHPSAPRALPRRAGLSLLVGRGSGRVGRRWAGGQITLRLALFLAVVFQVFP